jgi:hypothetical protein
MFGFVLPIPNNVVPISAVRFVTPHILIYISQPHFAFATLTCRFFAKKRGGTAFNVKIKIMARASVQRVVVSLNFSQKLARANIH